MPNTSQEARFDVKAGGFWFKGVTAFFDVRITHVNTNTNLNKNTTTIFQEHENCRFQTLNTFAFFTIQTLRTVLNKYEVSCRTSKEAGNLYSNPKRSTEQPNQFPRDSLDMMSLVVFKEQNLPYCSAKIVQFSLCALRSIELFRSFPLETFKEEKDAILTKYFAWVFSTSLVIYCFQ